MINVLLKTRLCTLHYRGNMIKNFDPQVICQRSGISVVQTPETGENSLKKRTNSLCLFAAISHCSVVYVMAFTKVTRPCYCLGNLETSLNWLSCPEIFFPPTWKAMGGQQFSENRKHCEVLKIQIHVLFTSFTIWKVFQAILFVILVCLTDKCKAAKDYG